MMAWFDMAKTSVGWGEADHARIAELRHCLNRPKSEIVDTLGEQLTRIRNMQPLMSNARFVSRLYSVLGEWLDGLLDGTFDERRVQERIAFGRNLRDKDLTFEDIILLDGLVRRQLFDLAQEQSCPGSASLLSIMHTLDKALTLDMMLIYNGYRRVREVEMERALLDRFITVTGFSRTLYENLAEAQGYAQLSQ